MFFANLLNNTIAYRGAEVPTLDSHKYPCKTCSFVSSPICSRKDASLTCRWKRQEVAFSNRTIRKYWVVFGFQQQPHIEATNNANDRLK
jgi:hypothetical protein